MPESEPDYRSGVMNLTVSQDQQTLSARVSVGLTPEQLAKLASDAGHAVKIEFGGVSAEVGTNASGEPAYHFTYSIREGNRVSGEALSSLIGEIRDRLLALHDIRYPYVRLTSY